MSDEVVKIDAELMKEIDKLISKNKFTYSSKKQVVNLALVEFLNKLSLNNLGKRGKKMNHG